MPESAGNLIRHVLFHPDTEEDITYLTKMAQFCRLPVLVLCVGKERVVLNGRRLRFLRKELDKLLPGDAL